jgi:hypothetical protein
MDIVSQKGFRQVHLYQFSPHIYIETFDEESVLLVADRDFMVTVNSAGEELFKSAKASLGNSFFSRSDCIDFLLDQYDLAPHEAEKQMRSLLGFGLKQYLLAKKR